MTTSASAAVACSIFRSSILAAMRSHGRCPMSSKRAFLICIACGCPTTASMDRYRTGLWSWQGNRHTDPTNHLVSDSLSWSLAQTISMIRGLRRRIDG